MGRTVKRDDEAVTTDWDYLAPSSSDGGDDYRSFLFVETFVFNPPRPRNGG